MTRVKIWYSNLLEGWKVLIFMCGDETLGRWGLEREKLGGVNQGRWWFMWRVLERKRVYIFKKLREIMCNKQRIYWIYFRFRYKEILGRGKMTCNKQCQDNIMFYASGISLVCCIVAFLISGIQIVKHLRNYTNPHFQQKIIGIEYPRNC